jgi:hypothetical protein
MEIVIVAVLAFILGAAAEKARVSVKEEKAKTVVAKPVAPVAPVAKKAPAKKVVAKKAPAKKKAAKKTAPKKK